MEMKNLRIPKYKFPVKTKRGFIKPNFSLHMSYFVFLLQLIEGGNAREIFLWFILNIHMRMRA